jgi:hypothetical protein
VLIGELYDLVHGLAPDRATQTRGGTIEAAS